MKRCWKVMDWYFRLPAKQFFLLTVFCAALLFILVYTIVKVF